MSTFEPGKFELAWDAKCQLGESPVWDERSPRLLFADIYARRIYRYARSGPDGYWTLPDIFPVPAPSMPCFVGHDLYVTSLYQHREALRQQFPTLGGLFRMRTNVGGAVIARFADA